jgi:hypothetical protein
MGDAQRRTWGAKYALRKAVNRLTGPMKTMKNAHNTGFLGPVRGSGTAGVLRFGGEDAGRAAQALRSSLGYNPLVNS